MPAAYQAVIVLLVCGLYAFAFLDFVRRGNTKRLFKTGTSLLALSAFVTYLLW